MRKLTGLLLLAMAAAPAFAQEKVDAAVMEKIRKEGLENSKVMDIAFYLTDVSGPRLAKSEGYTRASTWATAELKKWGLENANLEPWGDFGKSWDLRKSYVAMTAPYYRPLIAFPKTWTNGSGGLKNAEVILVKATDSLTLLPYKGKLKGKVIVVYKTDTLKHSFTADATRYADSTLARMAEAKPTAPRPPMDSAAMARMRQANAGAASMTNVLRNMAEAEGAVALLSMSTRGHDGTLFVQGGGAYAAGSKPNFLDIMVAFEDYMSICRLANAGIPVKLDVDVETSMNEKDTKGYNVIAEIKGTDPTLKEEIVMLGAHLDSWQGATGATDNAAGSAVMMEAVRILKTIGVKPRRTIRIALWNGEEQGLLGSRGYVKNHFADPATMQLKPEHAKFSSYFNIDNGTGKIRGIYTQGNEAVKGIFAEWLKPFADLGASTVTVSNTGGTDHQSFDAVGLPGFQFIQDGIEYNTRTHHTNMDSYDHLIAADLKQISTIVAAFVYNAAMRDEKLPRKELPKPRPGGGR